MATTKHRSGTSNTRGRSDRDNSSDWNGNGAALAGAAVAGVAFGLAANVGRKLFVQLTSGATGDWLDALKTEHQMALALFDQLQATSDEDTGQRSALLAKLKFALSKHAFQEENVIYPALRQVNETEAADHLNDDHGYVKTYLYELENLPNDDPTWLARLSDFRAMIEEHMREEENEIFPSFRARMSDDQNKKLTLLMNKEGLKLA